MSDKEEKKDEKQTQKTTKGKRPISETKVKKPTKKEADSEGIDDSLIIQGVTYVEENKLDTAMEAFEEFSEKHSKSHWGWYYIGYTQMLQDKKKNAMKNFKKATKINNDFLPSLYYQGLIEFEENNFQEALIIFDDIMDRFSSDEIKESNFNVPYFIAVCHHYLGNLLRAEEYFLFAYNLSPEDPVVLYYKGLNELVMRNYDFASETFKNLLAVDLNNQEFWNLFKGYSHYFYENEDKKKKS